MKIKVLGVCVLLLSVVLTGCSGGVSKEAKKLYNEQAEIYNKKIKYLEDCLKENEPTQQISFSYPTSFFHLTDDEKETWESADFGDEKTKMLETSEEIEEDADELKDAAPMITMNVTDEELKELNEVFSKLKEKYKDYDFEKAKVTLYE